jgi:hypothetical protein
MYQKSLRYDKNVFIFYSSFPTNNKNLFDALTASKRIEYLREHIVTDVACSSEDSLFSKLNQIFMLFWDYLSISIGLVSPSVDFSTVPLYI